MYKQLNIFDIVNETRFDTILNKLSKYGIDKYYRENFQDGDNHLIREIFDKLTKLDNYFVYLDELYQELKKYIPEIFEEQDDYKTVGMYKKSDCIRICEPKKWYSIGCLEMLNQDFLEEVEDE